MMNTLIIYSSKYGSTEKVAKTIANKIAEKNNMTLIHLKNSVLPDISGFDKVILGTPIYAGKSYGKMRRFCEVKRDELNSKSIGLFVCGMEPDEQVRTAELNSAYPAYLYDIAIAKEFINGELSFNQMNFFEKLIMKLMKKQNSSLSTIDYDAINSFSEKMQ